MTSHRRRGRGFFAQTLVVTLLLGTSAVDSMATEPSLEVLLHAAPGIDRTALQLALRANSCAQKRGLYHSPRTLTVIDYGKPSTEPRLWVFDLRRGKLLHRALVAHGRNSGLIQAVSFSNQPGSNQSSLGLFLTLDTYFGAHGRSLRLRGLEPGFNDRAYERNIVIHGAAYAEPAHVDRWGRLGRSLGCPVLSPLMAQRVIDTIRGGEPLFAYFPNPRWLSKSRLLDECDQRIARN